MAYLLIMLAVSLAVSSVGWLYFIYFFSIGYGFSIAVLTVTIAVVFRTAMTPPIALLCVILFIYGVRLALFLLIRERRSQSYKKILYQPGNTEKKPVYVMLMIWVSCALLYVGQTSPATFYLCNSAQGLPVNEAWAWAGAIVAAAGTAIEIIADMQKNRAKKIAPYKFVSTGLYSLVRCPNYFGEILLWTGSFIICFGACCDAWQWLIASLGYAGIIYVMFSGARRLELRQKEIYGNSREFKEYAQRTPLIIPFVPLYSVAKHKWLKG